MIIIRTRINILQRTTVEFIPINMNRFIRVFSNLTYGLSDDFSEIFSNLTIYYGFVRTKRNRLYLLHLNGSQFKKKQNTLHHERSHCCK